MKGHVYFWLIFIISVCPVSRIACAAGDQPAGKIQKTGAGNTLAQFDSSPAWVKKVREGIKVSESNKCRNLNASMAISMGDAVMANVTPVQAQQKALNRARVRAIEKVCGVRVQETTMVHNAVFAGAYLAGQSNGYVVDEEALNWDESKYRQARNKPPIRVVRVMLRTCVSCQGTGRDPYFQIKSKLNRSTFVSGDNAVINFSAGRDCFVYVFNLMADNKVRCLLPSPYAPDNRYTKGGKLHFPQEGKLEISTMPGHVADHEAFLVLATKKKADFSLLFKDGINIPITDFLKELVSIPVFDRKEQILIYEVRAR